MHRAVDLVTKEDLMDKVIIPDETASPKPPLITDMGNNFFNNDVAEVEEQKTAVMNIIRGEGRPAPYIVFGPPGTGKTNTIVEAILQVKSLFKKSFVLVCAASNAACDNISQKLMKHCNTKELLRLNSLNRDWKLIPEDVLKYSNSRDTRLTFHQIREYRIVVCTLITAGSQLVGQSRSEHRSAHHYTHVFIDEAGQALEPELMVALGGILGPTSSTRIGGQVVLAGDPLQLGPICSSMRAEKFGLGTSLLERLMTHCALYQRNDNGEFNPLYITKLRKNFRSKPSLLYLPNNLFYDNELQASCTSQIMSDNIGTLFLNSKVTAKVPTCIFHGVVGQEKKEGKSPSFYNLQELHAIVEDITILLRSCSSANVKQADIGVISPYIRQVYKIKTMLKSKGWEDIEVGTTETFQGREKRIILISTVRSNKNFLAYDKQFKLGFLHNEKRFNVAITRAQSLLIVVGCPHVLKVDSNWEALIAHSCNENSYKGYSYNLHTIAWTKQVLRKFNTHQLAVPEL